MENKISEKEFVEEIVDDPNLSRIQRSFLINSVFGLLQTPFSSFYDPDLK